MVIGSKKCCNPALPAFATRGLEMVKISDARIMGGVKRKDRKWMKNLKPVSEIAAI